MRIVPRDLEIIANLLEYGILTTGQVAQLHFSSQSRAQKRLFRLWHNKFIERYHPQVPLGSGSSQAYYSASRRGRDIVMTNAPEWLSELDVPRLQRYRAHSSHEHLIRRNDFRIQLENACKKSKQVGLLHWKQGNAIKKTVQTISPDPTPALKSVTIVPDGSFSLQGPKKSRPFYVEIDNGTTRLTRIRDKLRAYRSLRTNLIAQSQTREDAFIVLWVTSSRRRLSNMIGCEKAIGVWPSSSVLFLYGILGELLRDPGEVLCYKWAVAADQQNGQSLTDLID